MAGDRTDHRLNLHDDFEVQFWCMQLRCTRAELFAACKQVGSTRAALRAYFASRLSRRSER